MPLWKREDLHIPTRFTQIQRTLLLVAKVQNYFHIAKEPECLLASFMLRHTDSGYN